MKKLLAAILVVGSMAVSASATITISWQSSFGVNDPTIAGDTFDLASGSLVQLIWSSDNIINALNDASPTTPTGNDQLLDQQFTTFAGAFSFNNSYPESSLSLTEGVFLAGYVYVRVFNAAAPTVGDWYGSAGLVGGPLTDQDPTPGLADFADVAPSELFTLNQTIVPEPSVLAFLGIGAALVAVRRMRRS